MYITAKFVSGLLAIMRQYHATLTLKCYEVDDWVGGHLLRSWQVPDFWCDLSSPINTLDHIAQVNLGSSDQVHC